MTTLSRVFGTKLKTATPMAKHAHEIENACQYSPLKSAMTTPDRQREQRSTGREKGPPKPTRCQCSRETSEQSPLRCQPQTPARRSGVLACEDWTALALAVAAAHRSFFAPLTGCQFQPPPILHCQRENPNRGNVIRKYYGPPVPGSGTGSPVLSMIATRVSADPTSMIARASASVSADPVSSIEN